MRTSELVIEAQKKALVFDQEIGNMLNKKAEEEKKNESSKKVAVAILEFSNLMEEVYNRIIKRHTGKRVEYANVLGTLEYCNIDENLIQCLAKMKQFRNRIAHSILVEQPVIRYFKRENSVDRVSVIQSRMQVILENAKDDLEYAYVFMEAS